MSFNVFQSASNQRVSKCFEEFEIVSLCYAKRDLFGLEKTTIDLENMCYQFPFQERRHHFSD